MWAFLLSTAGKWLLGVVAVLILIGAVYYQGYNGGKVACELKQQQQMAKVEAYVKKIRERVERGIPLDDNILRPDAWQRDE